MLSRFSFLEWCIVSGLMQGQYHLMKTRMVASKTGECPHLVTTSAKFTGQFKCYGKCAMYAAYNVYGCSCKVNQMLTQFVHWLVKQNTTPNLPTFLWSEYLKVQGRRVVSPKTRESGKEDFALWPKVPKDTVTGFCNVSTTCFCIACIHTNLIH